MLLRAGFTKAAFSPKKRTRDSVVPEKLIKNAQHDFVVRRVESQKVDEKLEKVESEDSHLFSELFVPWVEEVLKGCF